MEQEIKISVMVPVYNVGLYLEKCIRSIMEQSLKEIEIICVNDGSTDNSLEILEKLAKEDKRIIVINKKNGGLTTARNVALETARGKYCICIDSDDWIEQGYFEAMYKKAEKDNLDIVVSDAVLDFGNKSFIEKDIDINEEKIIDSERYIDYYFNGYFYGVIWNKLIRREIYTENNLYFDEKIFFLEDIQMSLKLGYCAEKIGKINKAYYHYRQGENNGCKKKVLKKLKDIKSCCEELINFYKVKNAVNYAKKIQNQMEALLVKILIEEDYSDLEGYEEVLGEIFESIRKTETISKKYTGKKVSDFLILRVNLIKKIRWISPKYMVKIFQLTSKLKK